MKVQNMKSPRGNAVPNQFIITDGMRRVFQSYDATIVEIIDGQIYMDDYYWDCSVTTSKYRNRFTGMDTEGTKLAIKSGRVILKDLNRG